MVVGMGARRAATSLGERSLGTLGRSIFAQPDRGFLEIAACVPPRRGPARLFRVVGLEGVRRPEVRRTIKIRSLLALEPLDEACQEGRRHTDRSLGNANAHRFDPTLEKEGRAVLRGRPL